MPNKTPAAVRTATWNNFIGEDFAKSQCYVGCGSTISVNNFECGHILARSKGGDTTLQNLRPICGKCNRSMGNKNMKDFIIKYGFDSDLLNENIKKNKKSIMVIKIIIKRQNSLRNIFKKNKLKCLKKKIRKSYYDKKKMNKLH